MLTLEQIDKLEQYLFGASLQEVPKVFGQVLPLVFAELRTMSIALDQQSQEFVGHGAQPRHGFAGASVRGLADDAERGRVPAARGQQDGLARELREAPAEAVAREAGVEGRGERKGAMDTVAVDPHGVVQSVGGEVRHRKGEAVEHRADTAPPVAKRRGRPRKIRPIEPREGSDAGS